jgi:membrane protease YdiL (CAAX protease family)
LLPAIVEELFFRGFLQGQIQRKMPLHLAVVVTACVFSFVHFQFYGFFVRWLLGVLFGWMRVYSGSIIPNMIAHFCFNGFSILAAWLAYNTALIPPESLTETVAIPIAFSVSSAVGICSLLWLFTELRQSSDKT